MQSELINARENLRKKLLQNDEKLLKHIISITYAEDDKDKLLKSHSLRTIYRAIHRYLPSFILLSADKVT